MMEWPKHADGRPKKMGEMTADERREQAKLAVSRLKREFENPEVKAAIRKFLKYERP